MSGFLVQTWCSCKIALALLTVCWLSADTAFAQRRALDLPSSPSSARTVAESPSSPAKSPHRFWDRTNILLFSGVAVFRGLDYTSTRNMQARGREEILLPDDVVNNSLAFATVEAGGTLASVGISYLLHRTSHHKLERWMSIGHIAVTGFGVSRNYGLESMHRLAPQ
jgi:hypothetical protein